MNVKTIKSIVSDILRRAAAAVGLIEYNVNDPDVPLIIKEAIPPLPTPCPPFSVQGFTGNAGAPGTVEVQAAAVYTTLVHALELVQHDAESPLVGWGRTQNLIVVPRAGRQLNAYYDGHSLRFFYDTSTPAGKIVYTCESADVVSHELGHAVLDSMRPDLWSTASLEIMAFHESFGDMLAILSALWHEEVIDYVINETNGDLRQPNAVSRLAEEMGMAVYSKMGRGESGLRNAVNGFKYTPPEKLPHSAGPDELSAEPHSFSRVFTGAFYDLLCYQFDKNTRVGTSKRESLKAARDQAAAALLGGAHRAAASPRFYDSVVRAMLVIDDNRGGNCAEGINKCFSERGVLRPTPLIARPTSFKMDGKNSKILTYNHGATVRVGGAKRVKLIDNMAVSPADNPLYAVEVDIPNEHYLEYDERGRLKLEIPAAKEEVMASAKSCVDFLAATNRVGYDATPEHEKEFSVIDGRLKRNLICRRK